MRAVVALAVGTVLVAAGCSDTKPAAVAPVAPSPSSVSASPSASPSPAHHPPTSARPTTTSASYRPPPPVTGYSVAPPPAPAHSTVPWHVIAGLGGQAAMWSESLSSGGRIVTVIRVRSDLVRPVLHAGYQDPGGSGWAGGPSIVGSERNKVLMAFNGGFNTHEGRRDGYVQEGRTVVPIAAGKASAVLYADGGIDIGAWGSDLPVPGRKYVSVRQNAIPLVSGGKVPSTVDGNPDPTWGYTFDHSWYVSRSALGIDASGNVLFGGAASLSVRALAEAMKAAGAVRAMELDINPEWVCAFLYTHPDAKHPDQVSVHALLPDQQRPAGTFLSPYPRDFLTLVAR